MATARNALTDKQRIRLLREHLTNLTDAVTAHMAAMDTLMEDKNAATREATLARLANVLDMANDIALRFGLGQSFPAMARRKARVMETLRQRRAQQQEVRHG